MSFNLCAIKKAMYQSEEYLNLFPSFFPTEKKYSFYNCSFCKYCVWICLPHVILQHRIWRLGQDHLTAHSCSLWLICHAVNSLPINASLLSWQLIILLVIELETRQQRLSFRNLGVLLDWLKFWHITIN